MHQCAFVLAPCTTCFTFHAPSRVLAGVPHSPLSLLLHRHMLNPCTFTPVLHALQLAAPAPQLAAPALQLAAPQVPESPDDASEVASWLVDLLESQDGGPLKVLHNARAVRGACILRDVW